MFRHRFLYSLIIVALLFLCSSFAFAKAKQFISVQSGGSSGWAHVSDGTTSSYNKSYSLNTGVSVGFISDSYCFSISNKVGTGGFSGGISYFKKFNSGLFMSASLGVEGLNETGFYFGTSIGASFIGQSNTTINMGLAAEVGYISTTDYSNLVGVLGVVFDSSVPINDSLTIGYGISFGGITLFNRIYDKTSKKSYSLSSQSLSVGLTTSITYQYEGDSSGLRLNKK